MGNVITVVNDRGSVSWVPEEHPDYRNDGSELVAGGWLLGEPALVKTTIGILNNEDKVIINNWCEYVLSDTRDTLVDVVAAMHMAAGSRGILSASGWEVLNEGVPGLVDPDNNREDVVY